MVLDKETTIAQIFSYILQKLNMCSLGHYSLHALSIFLRKVPHLRNSRKIKQFYCSNIKFCQFLFCIMECISVNITADSIVI